MALQGRQQGVGEAISQGTFGQQGTSINAQIAQAQMAAANAARQQAYSEMVGNKTLPVNLATSLMTGSQVNAPQFLVSSRPRSIQRRSSPGLCRRLRPTKRASMRGRTSLGRHWESARSSSRITIRRRLQDRT